MKRINISLISPLIAGLVIGGLASVAVADVTTAQKFETCSAAAEVAYGTDDAKPIIRLQGVRKAGKQLRLRVSTPEGEGIAVLCDVDRTTGELLALTPPSKHAADLALQQNN